MTDILCIPASECVKSCDLRRSTVKVQQENLHPYSLLVISIDNSQAVLLHCGAADKIALIYFLKL